MVRSMTGYGRCGETVGGYHITVELRSVNHRYFEYSSRLPRAYGFLDDKLKTFFQSRVARGKLDVGVWIEAEEAAADTVEVRYGTAEAYLRALYELRDRYQLRDDISVMALARQPEVLAVSAAETDEEALWQAVQTVAAEALDRFVRMRETEGERLREDVLLRRETILHDVARIEERSPQTVREHMQKVEARMRELLDGAAVDEQRLLTEAAIYADRIAVAEETVRLRSHLDQLQTMLDGDEAVGRKLDFLVQEINREANTIGSKCQDAELARTVVNMKAEIEKIREQIQNLE